MEIGQIINEKYKLISKLGSGWTGTIFKGKNIKTNQLVAVKSIRNQSKLPFLANEAKIYKLLKKCEGFPKLMLFEQKGQDNIMVVELLGPTIDEMFKYCRRSFSLKTTLMIGYQMVERIECLHKIGYIHQDLHTGNFIMGIKENKNMLHIIDLGISQAFIDPKTGEHIKYTDNHGNDSRPFSSLYQFQGIQASRRDDLECIGLCMIYFLKGKLPWGGIRVYFDPQKNSRNKEQGNLEKLCSELPNEIYQYMLYCRNLQFNEEPNYEFLKQIFQEGMTNNGFEFDYQYDWFNQSTEIKKEEGKGGCNKEQKEKIQKWIKQKVTIQKNEEEKKVQKVKNQNYEEKYELNNIMQNLNINEANEQNNSKKKDLICEQIQKKQDKNNIIEVQNN